MITVVILIIILSFILLSIAVLKERDLINTFRNHSVIKDEALSQKSHDFIGRFELTLVNFDFLPSYKGKYQSILFKNKFQMECYRKFYILTIFTADSSYRIKVSPKECHIKKDIFSGKLLKVKVRQHNLLFKLPNEMQNIIYKNL